MLTRKKYLNLPENHQTLSADKIIGILTNQLIALDVDALEAKEQDPNFDRPTLAKTVAKELIEITNKLSDEVAIDILASASTAQPLFKETDSIPLLESSIRVRVLNQLNATFDQAGQNDLDPEQAANKLVAETKKLSHALALQLLSQALLHPLFASDQQAMAALRHGINIEAHNRSPLSLHPTYAFLRAYEKEDPNAVHSFLTNPNLVLNWIDKATALDTSKLIHNFFIKETEYFQQIIATEKDAELPQEQRDAAAVLLALVSPTQPDEEQRERLHQLATQLERQYEHRQLKSVQASLAVLISEDTETLSEANSHYLNLNRRNLRGIDLSAMQLRGAAAAQADLSYATMNATNFKAAQLTEADLSGAGLSEANLIDANLRYANLAIASLVNTKLQGADLSYADLSLCNLRGANLTNTVLEQTNFQDADFFCANDFKDINVFQAQLDNLQKMLTGHAYLKPLRNAISNSLISHLRSQEVDSLTAFKYLQLAHKHPVFSMHGEYNAAKVAANAMYGAGVAISNTFSSLFSSSKQQIPTHEAIALQTPAQEKIASEISRYPASVSKSLLQKRPPMPSSKPPPIPEESVRNSK